MSRVGASVAHDDGELDAERVLAWLGELIERTCKAPPTLVGYALGGAIATRFAAMHGDRLGGLVLVLAGTTVLLRKKEKEPEENSGTDPAAGEPR